MDNIKQDTLISIETLKNNTNDSIKQFLGENSILMNNETDINYSEINQKIHEMKNDMEIRIKSNFQLILLRP